LFDISSPWNFGNQPLQDVPDIITIHARFEFATSGSMSVLGELIDPTNSGADVWADSAYRSEQIEEELLNKGYRSRIQRKEL
jgi:hypothetical protein